MVDEGSPSRQGRVNHTMCYLEHIQYVVYSVAKSKHTYSMNILAACLLWPGEYCTYINTLCNMRDRMYMYEYTYIYVNHSHAERECAVQPDVTGRL